MNSEEYYKQFVPLLVGTKVNSINKKVIGKTKIPDIDEQKKIANFLFEYDKAIKIKRKNLETWKILKKGLL